MNVRNFQESSKKIREAIITFFKFRDCVTMVRPTHDEKDLQDLDKHPEKIREEFLVELNRIREKIYQQCGPKQLNGVNMTSKMYILMAKSFVEKINQNKSPNIQTAWESIMENECITALNEARDVYDNGRREKFYNKAAMTSENLYRE